MTLDFRRIILEDSEQALPFFEEGSFFEKKLMAAPFRNGDHIVSPLRTAVLDRNGPLAGALIPFSDINEPGPYHRTPLHEAVSTMQNEVAKLLLDAGADPFAVDSYGVFPMRSVLNRKHYDTLDIVISKPNVVLDHRFEKVHLLVSKYGTIDHVKTIVDLLEEKKMMTPKLAGTYFSFVVYSDDHLAVERLLKYRPFSLNFKIGRCEIMSLSMAELLAKDNALTKEHVIHSLARATDTEMIKFFLAFCIAEPEERGRTTFTLLHDRPYEVFELFIAARCLNLEGTLYRLKMAWNMTMIHLHCCSSMQNTVKEMKMVYTLLCVVCGTPLPEGEDLPSLFDFVVIKSRSRRITMDLQSIKQRIDDLQIN